MVSKLFETIDSSRGSVPIVDWGVKGTTMEDGKGRSCSTCIHKTPTAARCAITSHGPSHMLGHHSFSVRLIAFTQFEYNLKFALNCYKHQHTYLCLVTEERHILLSSGPLLSLPHAVFLNIVLQGNDEGDSPAKGCRACII